MKKNIIFCDTNKIRNENSVDNFLGNREELEKISKIADLIIPEIFLEEFKIQKKKKIDGNKENFFIKLFCQKKVDDFNSDDFIKELSQKESIKFQVICLENNEVLQDIKEMALKNESPFDAKTDKGFKDTYGYFTVKNYLENNSKEKKYFFLTKDERFKKAFQNSEITCVASYGDLMKCIIDEYATDYFKSKITEHLTLDNFTFIDLYKNISNIDILVIKSGFDEYYLQIETNEIIKSINTNFQEIIQNFCNSGSFANAHNFISQLNEYIDFFSQKDILKLQEAKEYNSQIRYIAKDEDIKQFYLNIEEKIQKNYKKNLRNVVKLLRIPPKK